MNIEDEFNIAELRNKVSSKNLAYWSLNELLNKLGIKLEDLKGSIEIDDNCLIWVKNTQDNNWYSLLGNYSKRSPSEKIEAKHRWTIENENNLQVDLFWNEVRQKVLERDNNTCVVCNKQLDKLHAHHIVPKCLGGLDYMDNLITVCPKCHTQVEYKEFSREYRNYMKETFENNTF